MTSPSDPKPSLINLDRMKRTVVCINPTHNTVTFDTMSIEPRCPICENLMVTVVKSALSGEIIDTPREE